MRKSVFVILLVLYNGLVFCQDPAFIDGLKCLQNGNFKSADSLFTISIQENPNANSYFNRAITRFYLQDTSKFCEDLKTAYFIHKDNEAKKLFLTSCAKVDTLYYDKKFAVSKDNVRYAELIVNENYSQEIWGEYIDLKDEHTEYSFSNKSGLNVNTFKSNVISTYTIEGNDKIFLIADYLPVFSKGDISEYVRNKIQYTNDLNSAISRINQTQIWVFIQFVVGTDGNVKDAVVSRKDNLYDQIIIDEALRVIRNLPKFKPARFKNQPVAIRMIMPIKFEMK